MKKSILMPIASMLLLMATIFSGCNDSKFKSLTELKRDQRKAIENFINVNKLNVEKLKDNKLPDNINPNTYYLLPNGLYIKVIDKGAAKPEVNKTHVFLQMEGMLFLNDTITSFNSISNPKFQPIEFIYRNDYNMGESHFALVNYNLPAYTLEDMMCEGLANPMVYLGDGARVSLIIPFTLGPVSFYKYGYPMYVKEAIYKFRNDTN